MTDTVRGLAGTDDLLSRFAYLVGLLEQRRATVARLARLVDQIAPARLIAVDAERELARRLAHLLEKADADIAALGAADAPEVARLVQRLGTELSQPDWAVADQAVTRLVEQDALQQKEIRGLNDDLGTYRLGLREIRIEIDAALQAGGDVDKTIKTTLAVLEGITGQAKQDADRGRYDTVAVAVATTRNRLRDELHIRGQQQFDVKLDEVRLARIAAEKRDAQMSLRAELFLITTADDAPPENRLEYRVLLRRPSSEGAQESSLYDTIPIFSQDREKFRKIIDDIAGDAVRSVAARSPRHIGLPTAAAPLVHDPVAQLKIVGKRMYSLLIPDAMQRLIAESNCPLRVTSNDLELPWELMHDGDDFLSLKRPFARMPVGRTYPRRPRFTPQPSSKWQVLLIHSDPSGNLPDAKREIDAVHQMLRSREELPVNIRVLSGEEATLERVTEELSSGVYDLIHYAGHAGFDEHDAGRSHLLLHGGQKFEAGRIQRVVEGLPIVFLNACESFQTDNEPRSLPSGSTAQQAQGLASAFVYAGAQACVGAMWPVFDNTARDLAVSFYELLFGRRRVGDALCEAKAKTYRAANADLTTWAAYALYGDPAYRLRGATPVSELPATLPEPKASP